MILVSAHPTPKPRPAEAGAHDHPKALRARDEYEVGVGSPPPPALTICNVRNVGPLNLNHPDAGGGPGPQISKHVKMAFVASV